MSALDAARERFLAQARARDGAADPGWLAALRRAAADQFAEQGLPGTRREEWRYTSLQPLAAIPFEVAPLEHGVDRAHLEQVCLPVFACSAFVFVNGRFAPELSAPGVPGTGLRVESLADAGDGAEELLGSVGDTKSHPLAALNTACFEDAAVLRVPPGRQVDEPIHLVFIATGGALPSVSHPRVLIDAGSGSRALVIQDHVSLGEGARFTNAVSEVRVASNASLDLVVAQREGEEVFHVGGLHTRQERDSRLRVHTVTLGAAFTRNDFAALLADTGAECTMRGLFVGTGSQLVDNHTLVDHAMPHGTSRQLYKGILGGSSRGVFRGRVIVRPDAQRTDATQQNPNLLLHDRASVNTKPQLEIWADDVKCSHGSTIGQLDDEALFYLQARGIGAAAARRLLTRGFAAEILAALPVEGLAASLGERLLARLEDAS